MKLQMILGQGTSSSLGYDIPVDRQKKHAKEEPENDDEYLCKTIKPAFLFRFVVMV